MENEERTYHNEDVPYALPNDATEHERLEIQKEVIKRIMHGQQIHAPLIHPTRMLEVGCGTGSMTAHLAESYPSAKEVFGIDISPIPARPSPTRATYIQGEFRRLAADPECPELSPNSFDYIYSRLLIFGMTDWPGYIARIKDLLKPGGWIELQDLDAHFFDENGNSICDSWSWWKEESEAFSARGLDCRVGSKLEQYLRDAGFHDVQVKKFRWVYGRWKGHPETDLMGDYNLQYAIPVNFKAYKKLLGASKSQEQLDADEQEMKQTLKFDDAGKHQVFYVVFGRKP